MLVICLFSKNLFQFIYVRYIFLYEHFTECLLYICYIFIVYIYLLFIFRKCIPIDVCEMFNLTIFLPIIIINLCIIFN